MLIPLSNGKTTIIDDEDFKLVDGHTWGCSSKGYAQSRIQNKLIRLHRLILNLSYKDGAEVDHINRNKLDNRKSNLRLCTTTQNCANRQRRRDNISGYKGVRWNVPAKKWQARIQCKGVSYHLGIFNKIEDAVMAYDMAAKNLFGDFACINGI